ncbi:hypothetical protein [Oceanimonas baumannii]|uniref:hypothetical protein n=1 Tax=Oceanimonas baumannii TaxID=129578 RepID=UPI003A945ADE
MNIEEFIWEWASHKDKEHVLSVFEFGESLEMLSLPAKEQVEALDGECPFLTAWYEWCFSVSQFRKKLNNRSIPSFYDNQLLDALDDLTNAFGALSEEECVEASEEIFHKNGWNLIREKSKLPLDLINWNQLKAIKNDVLKML